MALMGKKSTYKKIMTENTFVKMPKESTSVITNNKDAFDFFTSKRVFGEASWDSPPPFSSPEAQKHVDRDVTIMSKFIGKASQQVIKTMMDGVKSGRYDALDLQRGFQYGPVKRAHFGEIDFIKQLWLKVRDGFRRYSKDRKLR